MRLGVAFGVVLQLLRCVLQEPRPRACFHEASR